MQGYTASVVLLGFKPRQADNSILSFMLCIGEIRSHLLSGTYVPCYYNLKKNVILCLYLFIIKIKSINFMLIRYVSTIIIKLNISKCYKNYILYIHILHVC